eukprot:m.5115 g.5115  ORF g.5115 m.5115 type:complete len:536 (-) comp3209_c0_seq1:90-1697(-)
MLSTFVNQGQLQYLSTMQIAAVVIILVLGLLLVVKHKTQKASPPFVWLQWLPFIGHVVPMFAQCGCKFQQKCYEKYGEIFTIQVLGGYWTIIRNKEDIKKFVQLGNSIASLEEAYDELASFFPSDKSAHYKNVDHKLLFSKKEHPTSGVNAILKAIKRSKLEAWVPIMNNCLLEELMNTETGPFKDGEKVDLFEYSRQATCKLTIITLIGNNGDKQWIEKWVDMYLELDPDVGLVSPMESLQAIYEKYIYGERKQYVKIREMLLPMIDSKIEEITTGEESNEPDVLSSFVEYWYNKCNRDKDALISGKVRIANDMFLFFLASFSNTNVAVGWLLYHVVNNTNGVGERIQEEIDEHVGEGELTINNINKLTHIDSTMTEIARLYMSGTLLRKLKQKVSLTGYTLPQGRLVGIDIFSLARDNTLYTNPTHFNPARYKQQQQENDTHTHSGPLYLAFGAAPHMCVGRKLAIIEAAVVVVSTLKVFNMKLCKSDPLAGYDYEWFRTNSIAVAQHPPVKMNQAGLIWRPAGRVEVEVTRR